MFKDKIVFYYILELNENGQPLNNVYIIKPGEETNRGTGIIVESDLNQIKIVLN